jgi:hypothetical protein
MMTAQDRASVNASVVFAELEGEAVLLDTETGIYFGLDEVGTRIWQLLSGGAAQQEVVAALHQEYDVAEARLRADVAAFMEALVSKGLVRRDG